MWLAMPLVAAAVAAAALARTLPVRALVPVVLILAAVFVVARARTAAPRAARRRRGLELFGDRLTFYGDVAPQAMLCTDAPFGVTLITDQRRARLTLLLSSSAGTFSIGVAADE
ncbi:MAG TPA: IMP dehydrogenase, partial [Minicystis sp.]|nr:IMP dehydrogenase [Minicystis sp.]